MYSDAQNRGLPLEYNPKMTCKVVCDLAPGYLLLASFFDPHTQPHCLSFCSQAPKHGPRAGRWCLLLSLCLQYSYDRCEWLHPFHHSGLSSIISSLSSSNQLPIHLPLCHLHSTHHHLVCLPTRLFLVFPIINFMAWPTSWIAIIAMTNHFWNISGT